jgi:threonine dehydrogenase-like Zn-dependent dehydrogenase
MGSMVSFTSPRVAEVVSDPENPLGPTDVRLRTLYSGISAGTELTAYRGTNPYLTKRWDDDRRLFVDGSTTFEFPVDGWGYEEVGEVAEVGPEVTAVTVGDRVWGTWGHRTGTVQPAERAAARVLDRQRLGDGQDLAVDVAGEAVELQDLAGGLVDQAAAVDGGDHPVFTEQPSDQRDQGFGDGLPP